MAKRNAVRFEKDEYFSEPNYDLLSDDELDQLYEFGEIRSRSKRKKSHRKTTVLVDSYAMNDDDADWEDFDSESELSFDD